MASISPNLEKKGSYHLLKKRNKQTNKHTNRWTNKNQTQEKASYPIEHAMADVTRTHTYTHIYLYLYKNNSNYIHEKQKLKQKAINVTGVCDKFC